ncbi:MAG: molybdopterin-dependent oxidoreductase [Polyangiaceae bacterium]
MTLSRRKFIKIGGAALGAATAGSALTTDLWGLTPNRKPDPQTDGDQVVPTFCEMCFWKCGVLAHVKDGRVTKIVGNPEHPLSGGRLCPRGTGGTGLLYDPDRLKTPLIRREARGEQVFEAVSWDEALDHIANKLDKIRKQYGPEALAVFIHGFGGSWINRLAKAYGTANFGQPSYAQCRGAREVAFELTFGRAVGSPEIVDIENSRVLTLIGSHLGENMHNTQVQELARAIEKGGELVVVDPRFSVAAGKARYWLPIKPGTDIALLLAWMHVIVHEKLYDAEYVEKHTTGFEQLEKHLEDKTPEWAAVETGIESATIIETARFIAGAAPASLIHPGRHTAWYGDDTQRGRAIAILNALLGSWGRKGGFYVPTAMPVPAYPGLPKPEHQAKPPVDAPKGTVFPFLNEGLAHGLRDASLPGAKFEYPIKAWLVYGSNLIQALPEPKKTLEALQALDFVVAIDVLPAEITGWADVVLPEATYLERYDDLHAPPFKEGYVALRQPVVPPLHDSKPGWWIAKELAKRLGLGHHFPFEDVESYLDKRLHAMGSSLVQLRSKGVLHAKPSAIYEEDGVELEFDTPSKKAELFSQRLADVGLDPLPNYTPPEAGPPGSFRLLFGRTPSHTFGRTTNNRFLSRVYAENDVWLNAAKAKELGLSSGDQVTLVNQDGARSAPLAVRATERIRPDCVFMVHGYGHTAKGLTFAKGRGANDGDLCTKTKIDPVMGGTGMNVNFVKIERHEA